MCSKQGYALLSLKFNVLHSHIQREVWVNEEQDSVTRTKLPLSTSLIHGLAYLFIAPVENFSELMNWKV